MVCRFGTSIFNIQCSKRKMAKEDCDLFVVCSGAGQNTKKVLYHMLWNFLTDGKRASLNFKLNEWLNKPVNGFKVRRYLQANNEHFPQPIVRVVLLSPEQEQITFWNSGEIPATTKSRKRTDHLSPSLYHRYLYSALPVACCPSPLCNAVSILIPSWPKIWLVSYWKVVLRSISMEVKGQQLFE
jgi:hypothetical protein